MNKLPENNFDLREAQKIQVCWENVHLRNIGEKCLKGGAGKDMVLASLCVMNHLRLDHHYAEQVILGETPEEQGDPRIAECVTCFNKAMPMDQDMEDIGNDGDEIR